MMILVRICSSRVLELAGKFWNENDDELVFDPSQCIAKFEWCLAPNSDQSRAANEKMLRCVLVPVGDNYNNAMSKITRPSQHYTMNNF